MEENNVNQNRGLIREPLLAAILSFFFWGLGHAYNGQRKKGYFFTLSYVFLLIFYLILLRLLNEPIPESGSSPNFSSLSYLITFVLGVVAWLTNIYTAYTSAKKINEDNIILEESAGRSSYIFLRNVFLGFVIFLVFCIFLFVALGFFTRSART
jgi:hypothetical protein